MKYTFYLLLILLTACATPEAPVEPDETTSAEPREGITLVNGVERSELALLMRKMYDEMKLVSDSIEDGYAVRSSFYEEFAKITSAHATEPEKIDDLYQAMAGAFLTNYQAFEQDTTSQAEAFNIMIENCLVCHQNKCPGPVKAIKKLKIKP